jgi:hypothetical protein
VRVKAEVSAAHGVVEVFLGGIMTMLVGRHADVVGLKTVF